MTILDRIVETKGEEIRAARRKVPQSSLEQLAREAPAPRSLFDSLRRTSAGPRIIAEVKRASPSKGLIREDFDPVAIARAYEGGGAAGISVLTDETYFQGRLEFLRQVRASVSLPVLRKDFLIDAYQVWEARAAGADAVLLILAILDDEQLGALGAEAESLGMEVLYEVHDREELLRLNPFGPRLVGINNRNLRTFDVRLETTRELIPEVDPRALIVSESGFSRAEEMAVMQEWGAHAFLIGESLMRQPDPGKALAELIGSGEKRR